DQADEARIHGVPIRRRRRDLPDRLRGRVGLELGVRGESDIHRDAVFDLEALGEGWRSSDDDDGCSSSLGGGERLFVLHEGLGLAPIGAALGVRRIDVDEILGAGGSGGKRRLLAGEGTVLFIADDGAELARSAATLWGGDAFVLIEDLAFDESWRRIAIAPDACADSLRLAAGIKALIASLLGADELTPFAFAGPREAVFIIARHRPVGALAA